MEKLKKNLFISGIILIVFLMYLYFDLYRYLYYRGFFYLFILTHSLMLVIGLKLLKIYDLKISKVLKVILFIFAIVYAFLIFYYHKNRNSTEIENFGIIKKGVVIKKRIHSRSSSMWLVSEFSYKGVNYKSTLYLKKDAFNRVKLNDTVKIKFLEKFPKLNRTKRVYFK